MLLDNLLEKSFLTAPAVDANRAIDEARGQLAGGFSVDVIVPDEPDEMWAADQLVRPLVYLCESCGARLPRCGNVFVTFFMKDRIACVRASDVVTWARALLEVDDRELVLRYGPQEISSDVEAP
jgi:hypothetical protein